ncbi:MAG TPA: Phenylacetic acid catabolic protein [Polyangia bacterium]|nr:Phenylacetic acid catabolic protein [Polyangia bacterium]
MIPEPDLVDRLLRGQAVRERGAAELFERALPLAPDAEAHRRLLGHVAEEREHYERVRAVWSAAFARPPAELDAHVTARLAERPLPTVSSWLELAVAQFLFDRAGRFQIGEYVDSSFEPYRTLARDIVADERGHEDAGARALLAIVAAPGADRAAAQAAVAQSAVNRWLPVSLESFGRPGGEGNARAIAAGLKPRDSAEVARDFLADVAPTLAAAGLKLPR